MLKFKKYLFILSLAPLLVFANDNISASAQDVSIESLKLNGSARDLCITKRSNNIRYKECDGKSPQRFEISEPNQAFKIKRKGKCIVAEFKADVSEIRKDITNNVSIKMGECNPPILNPNKDKLKDLVVAFWVLDKGNRIRLKDNIGSLDICLADGDKNDRIKATDCSNSNNPGRWKISSAN